MITYKIDPLVSQNILMADAYLIKDVSINLGGRMYWWDLYVAPIEDDFLLGLDFMIMYKIDPLVAETF